MNFFEAQDRARRNTNWLVLLFLLAVAGLVILTNLLLLGILAYSQSSQPASSLYSWQAFSAVSIGVCLLVFGGSLYKTMSLSGGGSTIAEMLGGSVLPQASTDPQQRQLLNVVEEMAIAAGMPIPKVYLLEDSSINAFAAGNAPANAVIGITHGTLTRLNRDELQGVIAHEFSHIANGDMRLNIRLIGVLHGILLIGMIGYFITRSLRYSRRSSNSKNGGGIAAIALMGFGLMVIGYTGTFFGQWIKSSVSRQREYLADSSAVQFTRNKDGIANALKKIGGSTGSYIGSSNAPEYSHAYFANGISSFWLSLFATHPPLENRIKQLDPGWDGRFIAPQASQIVPPEASKPGSASAAKVALGAAILTSAEQAIARVGTLNEENIEYVQQLIIAMPPLLRSAVQDAFSARALVYSMLVVLQKDRPSALASLSQNVDPTMYVQTEKLMAEISTLRDQFKLPLLELSIGSLRELSPNQFVQFKSTVDKIVTSDRVINLSEWIVQRFLIQQLDQHFGFRKPARPKYARLEQVKTEAAILLSLIANVGHADAHHARKSFEAGATTTGLRELEFVTLELFKLAALNRALDKLAQLKPLVKPQLLKACMAVILYNEKMTPGEFELVRTISSCLDCPMPPVPGGTEF
ncbi:MAG: M48 family metallopeptidase [Gammaproteobacteria bacterium]|nr:M48 family metallopeptidase [Gammaproteobacteria bacterium]